MASEVLEAPPVETTPTPAATPAPPSPAIPQPVTPISPPKPGSAKERLFSELRKKAKPSNAPSEPLEPAQPPKTAPDPSGEPSDSSQNSPEGVELNKPDADDGSQPAKPGAKPKVNPWKLIDEYKTRLAAAEKAALDAKGSVVPEEERKTITERLQKAETRAKELEDHIRYVDYSKSEEFKTKYQEPYEKAWGRAISELKEIYVTDPGSDQPREATVDDLALLINQPLGKARELANAMFGDFADDVMAHRKEIRNLFEAQSGALEEARKNGADRLKQQQESMQKVGEQIKNFVSNTWKAANDEAVNHAEYGQYFKQREGDKDWNQRLGKGFELVDKAFSQNPMDPKLSAEDRANVVRMHAAVRHRAAAFGALVFNLKKQTDRVAQLEKELAQYKGSEPTTGGHISGGAIVAPTSAKDAVYGALRKLAK